MPGLNLDSWPRHRQTWQSFWYFLSVTSSKFLDKTSKYATNLFCTTFASNNSLIILSFDTAQSELLLTTLNKPQLYNKNSCAVNLLLDRREWSGSLLGRLVPEESLRYTLPRILLKKRQIFALTLLVPDSLETLCGKIFLNILLVNLSGQHCRPTCMRICNSYNWIWNSNAGRYENNLRRRVGKSGHITCFLMDTFLAYSLVPKMEAVRAFETSVNFYDAVSVTRILPTYLLIQNLCNSAVGRSSYKRMLIGLRYAVKKF